ncbi:MAG: radical SAM protein, partial [Patescibacteria group bacterium]
DFIVVGEGEITFFELVKTIQEKKYNFENINGLYFKKENRIIKNQPRELISDLDSIPFPARDLFDLNLYSPAPTKRLTDEECSPILTSRGCAFDCIHCVSKSIWKRKIRYRSSENIIAEIEECINKYNIKEFSIIDDNFTLNKNRAIEFCQKVIEKKLPIAWICFSRADGINDELVKIMAKAGCKKISLGLESGSQKILDLMRKQTTIEQGKNAVEIIRKNKILVHASFMIGNIGETKETARETIDFAKNLDLDNASFFITCPVPGSDLYYYARDNGFINNKISWEMFAPLSNTPPVLVQNNLSQNDLIYWQKKAFKEFYFRPKYIYRKLKQIKSWEGIKTIFQGVKILLRILFKPKTRTT